MKPTDLTIRILTEIRDEIRGTNSRIDDTNTRLDQTNARLDQTNARLDQTNARLDQTNASLGQTNASLDQTNARLDQTVTDVGTVSSRLVEAEIRTATAIAALGGTLEDVRTMLRDRLDLRDRVQRCEQDIVLLKDRTGVR